MWVWYVGLSLAAPARPWDAVGGLCLQRAPPLACLAWAIIMKWLLYRHKDKSASPTPLS
jgi:hypothetical protein